MAITSVSALRAEEGHKKDDDLIEVDHQLAAADRFMRQAQWDKADARLDMAARLRPDDPRLLLGRARSDAGRGRCAEALSTIDRYFQLVKKADAKALEVLVHCPRATEGVAAPFVPEKPTPKPATKPSKAEAGAGTATGLATGAGPATGAAAGRDGAGRSPRATSDATGSAAGAGTGTGAGTATGAETDEPLEVEPHAEEPPPRRVERPRPRRGHIFLLDIGAGLRVPLTSDTVHVDFLGTVELGVALSNRAGLDLVLIAESTVSRAPVQAGSTDNVTVFSENLLLGLEERRQVWRRLTVFGTIAAGITVDSFHGFVAAAVLHADVGLGLVVGPGEFRLRPANFTFLVASDSFGAAYGATAGYAFRL
jgi:hypothetical protein